MSKKPYSFLYKKRIMSDMSLRSVLFVFSYQEAFGEVTRVTSRYLRDSFIEFSLELKRTVVWSLSCNVFYRFINVSFSGLWSFKSFFFKVPKGLFFSKKSLYLCVYVKEGLLSADFKFFTLGASLFAVQYFII